MGRWFGYRPNFEDLCRVHLSRDSINWYAHIAEAAEELVQQVKRMRRDKLSPKDFGLYVRSHPDTLLITASNKMRAGEQVTVQQSFSGRLRETSSVSIDPELNKHNFDLFAELWRSDFGGAGSEDTGKGYIYKDVKLNVLEDFLLRYDFHSFQAGLKSDLLAYLQLIADRHPNADVLLISPEGGSGGDVPYSLRNQERIVGEGQPEGSIWKLNKDRVASRGDEKLGLTDPQKDAAAVRAESKEDGGAVSDTHYREIRNKPLLMLHSLGPKSKEVKGPIAAFGMSFPFEKDIPTIDVVVNRIWLRQMQGTDDNPDDEEDWDA
jgi:hypothetical protein